MIEMKLRTETNKVSRQHTRRRQNPHCESPPIPSAFFIFKFVLFKNKHFNTHTHTHAHEKKNSTSSMIAKLDK